MKYFNATSRITPESLKAEYRRLCTLHHPDKGGKAADFIAMKQEYIDILSRMSRGKSTHQNKPIDQDYFQMFNTQLDFDLIINRLEELVSGNDDLKKCVGIFKILIH